MAWNNHLNQRKILDDRRIFEEQKTSDPFLTLHDPKQQGDRAAFAAPSQGESRRVANSERNRKEKKLLNIKKKLNKI